MSAWPDNDLAPGIAGRSRHGLQEATVNLPEGFDIDPEARRLTCLGVDLPVAHCYHHLAEPEQTETFGLKLLRPHPAQEESAHLNVLCGENGWWVEVDLWLGSGEVNCCRPDEPGDGYDALTAEEMLRKWRETCERRDHPRDAGVDEEDDAFGGMTPGTWLWDRGERHVYSPAQEEELRVFFRRQFPSMYEDPTRGRTP